MNDDIFITLQFLYAHEKRLLGRGEQILQRAAAYTLKQHGHFYPAVHKQQKATAPIVAGALFEQIHEALEVEPQPFLRLISVDKPVLGRRCVVAVLKLQSGAASRSKMADVHLDKLVLKLRVRKQIKRGLGAVRLAETASIGAHAGACTIVNHRQGGTRYGALRQRDQRLKRICGIGVSVILNASERQRHHRCHLRVVMLVYQ